MGFNNYKSEVFDTIITNTRPKTIIEVGTWLGGSAFTMCKAIKKNKLQTKLYCVDTWLGSLEFIDKTIGLLDDKKHADERDLELKNGYPQIYYQFLSNVIHTNNKEIIIPVPNTSAIASRYFENNKIKAELTFIDGSHDREDVYSDLHNYYPLTSKVLFGDDYHWNGVKYALEDFCRDKKIRFELLENNFWVIEK